MWQTDYEKLSHGERDEFTRLINMLMAKNFVLRDKLSTKEKTIRINRDYRFIERYFELFREYLRISGWELQRDNNYGVMSLYNIYEMNRARLDKFTTFILFTLRLIYEEQREKLSLKREILTTVGDVIKKMMNLGLIDRKPADKDLNSALAFMKNYNIIDKIEGNFIDYDTQIIIYPSILFIVTSEKINDIYDMLGISNEDEEMLYDEEDN